jgi:hypothetical protein
MRSLAAVTLGFMAGEGTLTRVTSPRYRCSACGNLTRFDVVTSRRTRAFHHFNLGGELTVEDETVLDEVVEEVTCRWCSSSTAIERFEESEV